MFDRIYRDELISYYEETSTDLDQVLDVFIRINLGRKVTPAEILTGTLSMTIPDIRTKLGNIAKGTIYRNSQTNKISDDAILKAALLCFSSGSISYLKVGDDIAYDINKGWNEFEKSYNSVTEQLSGWWNIGAKALTSANALAILVYFLYRNKLWNKISDHSSYTPKLQDNMRKWLVVVLLKQVFGGQSDGTLLQISQLLLNTVATFPRFRLCRV